MSPGSRVRTPPGAFSMNGERWICASAAPPLPRITLWRPGMAQLLPTFRAKCNARTVGIPAPFLIGQETNQACKRGALEATGAVPVSRWRCGACLGTWQLTTIPAGDPTPQNMDTEGFEPSTSRMRNGRSSTELSALLMRCSAFLLERGTVSIVTVV